jgi:transcriptional regulator with XRE-family HTH domain
MVLRNNPAPKRVKHYTTILSVRSAFRNLFGNVLINKSLGQRIVDARGLAGLSQDALAAAVGVHPQTISKWERDQTTLRAGNLRAVASALGLSVEELTGAAGAPSAAPGVDDLTAVIMARDLDEDRRERQIEALGAAMRAEALLRTAAALEAEGVAAQDRARAVGAQARAVEAAERGATERAARGYPTPPARRVGGKRASKGS